MAKKKKEQEFETIEQTIPIKRPVGFAMFLRNAVGDGEIDGVKFSVTNIIPTGDLHVAFGEDHEKGVYIGSMQDFVRNAYEHYKEVVNGPNVE